MNEELREQVRKIMQERGLTQRQLADELGISAVYVNRMLSGRASNMPGRWVELLNVLGLRLTVAKGEESDAGLTN